MPGQRVQGDGHPSFASRAFRVAFANRLKQEIVRPQGRRRELRGDMVRPLTKTNKDGVRYVRPQAVETEIKVALQEDRTALRRRLMVTDRRSPEYLRSECLVHLIRDALRRRDEDRLNEALPILLSRCEAILKAKIANSLPGADELREEVLSEFSELLASDGMGERPDELDFYECRFNMAFRTLRIDVVNANLAG